MNGRNSSQQQRLMEQLTRQLHDDSQSPRNDSASERPESSLSAASDYRTPSHFGIPNLQNKSLYTTKPGNALEESKQGERGNDEEIKQLLYSMNTAPSMFAKANSSNTLQRTPDFRLREANTVKTVIEPTLRMHTYTYPGPYPEKAPVKTGMLTHKDINTFTSPFFVQTRLEGMSRTSPSPLGLNILAAKQGTAFNESDHESFKRLLQENDVLAIELNCPFSDDTCMPAAIVETMNEEEKAALVGKICVLFHGMQGYSTPEIDKGVTIFQSIPETDTSVCRHDGLPNHIADIVKKLTEK